MNRTAWLENRRMSKFKDVFGRWTKKQLSGSDAAEILGMSERSFRRYRHRYEEEGEGGLSDKRLGKASAKGVPADRVAWMLDQYRTHYRGWSVKHFHEHLQKRYRFHWGYTWTKTQLQAAGLVERAKLRGAHRRKRPRKPCVGMMLHQDGSRFAWLSQGPELDLIVTLDDATSEIYSAFLVEEEGTDSTFEALLDVFTREGLPSSLYSDRGSHYFLTPKAGEEVDKQRLTQVGRALKQLGVEHIPAYSPEARGRSERMFGTLQDRLTKELALAGITEKDAANAYIRDVYLPEHNARFAKPPELEESAFVRMSHPESLAEHLCVEEERVVNRDNTVAYERLELQLPESRMRAHYVKARVKVRRYPNGTLAVFHGPKLLARYNAQGEQLIAEPVKIAA
jgi:transposase